MSVFAILYEQQSVPFELTVSAKVSVSAAEAKRTVNRYVGTELSTNIGAETPELIIDAEQTFWRVPLILAFPFSDTIGIVGSMLVDAQTAELHTSPENDQQIIDYATRLYEGFTLQAKS